MSKNRSALQRGEKQVQYIMQLREIRPLRPGEAEKYWPGTEGRWKYLVECDRTERVNTPFDLQDVLGENAAPYQPVMTFSKLRSDDEQLVREYLRRVGSSPLDE